MTGIIKEKEKQKKEKEIRANWAHLVDLLCSFRCMAPGEHIHTVLTELFPCILIVSQVRATVARFKIMREVNSMGWCSIERAEWEVSHSWPSYLAKEKCKKPARVNLYLLDFHYPQCWNTATDACEEKQTEWGMQEYTPDHRKYRCSPVSITTWSGFCSPNTHATFLLYQGASDLNTLEVEIDDVLFNDDGTCRTLARW